jgi:hypothetical protein
MTPIDSGAPMAADRCGRRRSVRRRGTPEQRQPTIRLSRSGEDLERPIASGERAKQAGKYHSLFGGSGDRHGTEISMIMVGTDLDAELKDFVGWHRRDRAPPVEHFTVGKGLCAGHRFEEFQGVS